MKWIAVKKQKQLVNWDNLPIKQLRHDVNNFLENNKPREQFLALLNVSRGDKIKRIITKRNIIIETTDWPIKRYKTDY